MTKHAPISPQNASLSFSDSFFCSLASCAIALLHYLLRLGFSDNMRESTIAFLGVALFILNGPAALIHAVKRRYPFVVNHESAITIMALIVIMGLAPIGIVASRIFSVAGYFLFAHSFFRVVQLPARNAISVVLFSVLFGLVGASLAWSCNENTMFLESMAFDLKGYCCYFLDPLFQASVAQMIKTYGVSSTGLDAVPYIHYHTGSHWMFSHLSLFFKSHVIDVIQIAHPIIFIPLFAKCLLVAVSRLKQWLRIEQHFNGITYFYFIVVFIGFLHVSVQKFHLTKYVSGTLSTLPTFLSSESYLISIIVFVFSILVIVQLYVEERLVVLTIVAPTLLAMMSFIKISTGFIFLAFLIFFIIRLSLYKKLALAGSFIASVIIFVLIYQSAVDQKVKEGSFSFLFFYKTQKIYFIPFVIIYFFFTWVTIGLLLSRLRITSFASLRLLFKEKKLLLPELLIVLTGVSIAPSIVLNLSSYNAFYFMDIIFWLSIVTLLSFSSYFYRPLFSKYSYSTKMGVVFSCLFGFLILYFSHAYYNSVKTYANKSVNYGNLRVRKLIYGDTVTSSFIKELKSYFRNEEKKDVLKKYYQKAIEVDASRSEYYELLKRLKKLDTVAVAVKSRSLLYVNYSKLPYLHELFCYQVPLVFPALTGMAMIEGAPAHGCIKEGYGFDYYKNRSMEEYEKDWSPVELCDRVRNEGFEFLCYYDLRENRVTWYDAKTYKQASINSLGG